MGGFLYFRVLVFMKQHEQKWRVPTLLVPKLLVLDNYDSFTYNLVQMFMRYDLNILVHRSDKISLEQIKTIAPDYSLISPGPRDPSHTGVCIPFIKAFFTKIPILGVCLGMQCINEAFGGSTVRASVPVHGKTSMISHNGDSIFNGMPSPFEAARYHSLIAKAGKNDLVVTANSQDGLIMGLSHPTLPLHGVQFHPESFMTEHGSLIVDNFLKLGSLRIRR
jgi:anthranilate synthase component 2